MLIEYNDTRVRNSGLVELLGPESIVTIPGGHDAGGGEAVPLDEEAVRAAILARRDEVFGLCDLRPFSVRNPRHEIRARELVRELTRKPVTCGHELAHRRSARHDAPRRSP